MTMLSFIQSFISYYLKIVFLLTPFFVLGYFLSVTSGHSKHEKGRLAYEVAKGSTAVCLIIFFCGRWIMSIFGITVDAFRAGSGILLMLTAIAQVRSTESPKNIEPIPVKNLLEMALVPMAVPITSGPAVLGTLMVSGMDFSFPANIPVALAIIAANATIGYMLYQSSRIEQYLGRARITILTKLTGLILAAIAIQMITIGVRSMWLSIQ